MTFGALIGRARMENERDGDGDDIMFGRWRVRWFMFQLAKCDVVQPENRGLLEIEKGGMVFPRGGSDGETRAMVECSRRG
jgi:hypothetical protein